MELVNAIIHRIELFSILCLVALYSQSDDVYEEIFFIRSGKVLLHISKLCSFHVSSMLWYYFHLMTPRLY